MAKFVYNNAKNASNAHHTLFDLNCGYHASVFFKKNINYPKFKLIDKLLAKLQELIMVCRKIIHYTQKL